MPLGDLDTDDFKYMWSKTHWFVKCAQETGDYQMGVTQFLNENNLRIHFWSLGKNTHVKIMSYTCHTYACCYIGKTFPHGIILFHGQFSVVT